MQLLLSFANKNSGHRNALVERWNELLRHVLPNMTERCGWPISQDHCFMRVCLDAALGGPWQMFVRRPAIRHLTDEQLSAAIAIAEMCALDPGKLVALNRQSILSRRAHGK